MYNDATWGWLHPMAGAGIAVGNIDGDTLGKDDVVMNFPTAPAQIHVWTWKNDAVWQVVHPFEAQAMSAGLMNYAP